MRVPLTSGAYSARSIIASAQRCVNLYAEVNPASTTLELSGVASSGVTGATAVKASSAAPFTYYPTPGTLLLANPPTAGAARCLYRANSNDLYYVVGSTVYYVSPLWSFTQLGTIDTGSTPVSITDNGTTALLVDGTSKGYQINLTSRVMSQVTAATNSPGGGAVYAFYGGTRTDAIDGYVVLNRPGTRDVYCTYNNQLVFDSTFFSAKNGFSDNLVAPACVRRQIWLIGERTTEIWFDVGGTGFPFEIIPGPFVQHGCIAKYSIATNDGGVYFLSQDQAGTNIMVRGAGYEATRISTHALEAEWSGYSTTADAVGFCFQQNGHPFYQINFPSADRSWRYDESTQQWHEPVYTDNNGVEHRHRVQCVASAYGKIVAGDWQTGALYALDADTYTDNGAPMQFRRGWPHLMNNGDRVRYASFAADMQCGDYEGYTADTPYFPMIQYPWQAFGSLGTPAVPGNAPQIALRWSDDRGKTFGNPVWQSMGATGEYRAQPQWNRLGMARDRVFELFGVIPGSMAINGAFIEVQPSAT